MRRELLSVADFADSGPFTENQLRWWIFNADENGLTKVGAIVHIQRRVYIDVNAFDKWIDLQNRPANVKTLLPNSFARKEGK